MGRVTSDQRRLSSIEKVLPVPCLTISVVRSYNRKTL